MSTRGLGFSLLLGAVAIAAVACGGPAAAPETVAPTATPTLGPVPTAGGPVGPTATPTQMTAQPTATQSSQQGDPAKGKQLAESNGCTGCHSIDGSKIVGPTWKGLYGSTVTLSDGSTVTADDAYLKDSIVSPDKQIPKGFTKGVMPTDFSQKLSASDVQDIIAYIKTLK